MHEQRFEMGDRVVMNMDHGTIEAYELDHNGFMYYRVKWDTPSKRLADYGWNESLQLESTTCPARVAHVEKVLRKQFAKVHAAGGHLSDGQWYGIREGEFCLYDKGCCILGVTNFGNPKAESAGTRVSDAAHLLGITRVDAEALEKGAWKLHDGRKAFKDNPYFALGEELSNEFAPSGVTIRGGGSGAGTNGVVEVGEAGRGGPASIQGQYGAIGIPVTKVRGLEQASIAYGNALVDATRASENTHTMLKAFNDALKRHAAARVALDREQEMEKEGLRANCQLADASYLSAKKRKEDAYEALNAAAEAAR